MNKLETKRVVDYALNSGNNEALGNSVNVYAALFRIIPFGQDFSMTDMFGQRYMNRLIKEFKMETVMELWENKKYQKPSLEFKIVVDKKNKVIAHYQNWRNFILLYPPDMDKKVLDKYLALTEGMFRKPKPKRRKLGRIYMLAIKGTGMKSKTVFAPFKLDKFNLSVEKNYNDDFQEVHNHITKCLSEKDGNGIVILHGKAGTGKTFYLKHLCKTIKKKILYIPPAMVQYIVAPDFMQLLSKHKNSILVIEDADNVLRKRDVASDVQDVSSILNIADGMLHDILKLQIVCTFNTKLTNIDEAFLRKGRLIAEYEMTDLSQKKAQELSDHLGFKSTITKDMPVTNIYNQNSPLLKEKDREKMGFKFASEKK